MSIEEMIKELRAKGYTVYSPLSEGQNEDADRCAESGCEDCMDCSCFRCLAGNDY